MNWKNMEYPHREGSSLLSHPDVIVISDEKMNLQVHPTVRMDCPKCDGTRAVYWTTLIGDEEESVELQVFKCTKCRYTWREKG
jgi:DNA-directed RNA polymerase subunit M